MSPARSDRSGDGTVSPEEAVLGQLMLAFEGSHPPRPIRRRFAAGAAAGLTLFRFRNVESPAQVRELTASLERAAAGQPPLLVATDQEGGQLVALGEGTTAFPGAMALGAADDVALTRAVARATGLELRALGVTVDYAPVCDLAVNPRNAALGTRSFGSRPDHAARHVAAFVEGLAEVGVAGSAKHFPGKGDVSVDTHHGLGIIEADRAGLEARELVPFRAAIEAGAGMVMSGHFAVPGVTGERGLPSTLSGRLMSDLLRRELGFRGVSITDALDMRALAQGSGQIVDAVMALRAGVDILLGPPDRAALARLEGGLRQAALRGLVPSARIAASRRRILALRRWLGRFPTPPFEVVGSAEHAALARRVADAALTLVRDDARLLPLRLAPDARVTVVTPAPRDLTPADTSSTVRLDLAVAVRAHHAHVDDLRVASDPDDGEIAAVVARAGGAAVAVVGTIATDRQPGQARLVRALLATGVPLVTVALRTPYDLADYPDVRTHLCSYSIDAASVAAFADGLFGRIPIKGRLPAAVPGLHPAGHRAEVAQR